jgi:hypothetical protein
MKFIHSLLLISLIPFGTTAQAAQGDAAPEGEVMRSKPESQIGVAWKLTGEPVVGQPLEIVLTISAEVGITGARLTLGVDDPLPLLDPAGGEMVLADLDPGTPVEAVVTVLPLVTETQYLRIAVSGQSAGGPQLRTLSIAVRFESAARQKDDRALTVQPLEEVHSLQAVETVR